MSDTLTNSKLEAARTRLEKALSGLAQGVANTQEAFQTAKAATDENTVLKAHIQSLEQENLKLHEQVASLSLQSNSEDQNASSDETVLELEAAKASIEQNYQLLKNRYAALQDELENLQQTPHSSSDGDSVMAENLALRQEIASMKQEKETLKGELDKAIATVETMLEDA